MYNSHGARNVALERIAISDTVCCTESKLECFVACRYKALLVNLKLSRGKVKKVNRTTL